MKIDFRKHMNLLVGWFVVSALIIMFMAVALYFNFQGIFNPEYRLFAVFENGIGLRKGTAVLYKGVKIGSVKEIGLVVSNGRGEGSGRVIISLSIDAKFKTFITDKSVAYVMRDKNLVSDRVINLESPGWSDNVLEDRDTLKVGSTRDIESVLSSITSLMDQVDGLLVKVDSIIYKVNDPGTTVGAMLGTRELYDKALQGLGNVNQVLEEGALVLHKAKKMEESVNQVLPGMLSNADTTFTSIMNSAGELEKTMGRMDGILDDAEGLVAKVESFLDEGSGTLENADEVMKAVSEFWFVRGKIKKMRAREFPLLGNGIGI
ncbi:MlaD family protein [Fibrobacterota bacterium]